MKKYLGFGAKQFAVFFCLGWIAWGATVGELAALDVDLRAFASVDAGALSVVFVLVWLMAVMVYWTFAAVWLIPQQADHFWPEQAAPKKLPAAEPATAEPATV